MRDCRCGHPDGSTDPHPCHARGYTCGQPAQQRIYLTDPSGIALAGVQLKFGGYTTWACDDCWKAYIRRRTTTPGEPNGDRKTESESPSPD
jgi:hypothetical protein